MVFSSLPFLFRFLPLVLAVYFVVPRRFRNLVLFIFSLIFYAWGEPRYLVLIMASTVVDYTVGRVIDLSRMSGKERKAKRALICSVIVNLLLLGIFKYLDFLIGILNFLPFVDLPATELSLPIGISFYTFQTMSYSIDVYRGEAKVQKNFISFGAFVSMFPQLIAGPVVRYKTIAKELDERKESADDFAEGIRRFVIGLAKKVLIANQVGAIFSEISAMSAAHLSVLTAWVGILAYTLQIYFDFSGYSDMAIGLGRMFGFHFLENFDHPYESKSITEFWRRWHISMSTWFKEYVYIPLGGNRRGSALQIRNILIVWFLTGLWHGASWNFVLWGLYYGGLLLLEKVAFKKVLSRLPGWVGHVYTIILVMFGWAIFTYADMADGMGYLGALFGRGGNGLWDSTGLYLLFTNSVLFIAAILGSTSLVQRVSGIGIFAEGRKARAAVVWIMIPVLLIFSTAFLVNSSYNPFLYFRF